METLQHKFVEFIPDKLEEGFLYISMECRTAIHKCVCGCGNEVVTPFSPTDWELRFYGTTVSLSPSIGNWSFECQSHYWIVKNQIKHAGKWNDGEIEYGKIRDKERKEKFYKKDTTRAKEVVKPTRVAKRKSKFSKFKSFFNFLSINN